MKEKRLSYCILIIAMLFLAGVSNADIILNEMMSSNEDTILDDDGEASDWIEIYNRGENPEDLEGYYLSDDADELTKWKIPGIIMPPQEYLLIWASGKDKVDPSEDLHTNFSIKKGGEELFLIAPDGFSVIDSFPEVELEDDESFGKFPDGGEDLMILSATPGTSNMNIPVVPDIPFFSHDAGFYGSDFYLTISSSPDADIYYTLDGSVPTVFSSIYEGPIHITNRTSSPNLLSMIESTSPRWISPNGNVIKSTVVRAMAVIGNESSKVSTATYFLDGNFTMPVISLSMDDSVLFDYDTGIYTMGAYWDAATDWSGTDIFHPANYQNKGSDWERPVHIEIFWEDGAKVIDQDVGMRISGQGSRVRAQKSFKLYARSDYGDKKIEYPLFPNQDIDEYKRLWIRNGDDDSRATYIRDVLANKIMEGSELDTESYYPSVVFINGEYWGFYALRDRASQFFIEERYGVDKDEVIILKDNLEVDEGEDGDEIPFMELMDFVRDHDMTSMSNYEAVEDMMDIQNFVLYNSINMFVANTDWIDRNLVYWHINPELADLDGPEGYDGRWRWIMHDNDWSFSYRPDTEADIDMFDFMESKTWGSTLWRGLSKNEMFRDEFVRMNADLLSNRFSTENVISLIDDLEEDISPEIQRQINRWNHVSSVSEWEENIEGLRGFANVRPNYYREDIIEYFGLGGTYILTVDREGKGEVQVNSLIPDTYPYGLTEFEDVPVMLHAVPDEGYMFIGWEGSLGGNDPAVQIVSSEDIAAKAVFSPTDSTEDSFDGSVWIERKYPATHAVTTFDEIPDLFEIQVANPHGSDLNLTWTLDGSVVSKDTFSYNSDLIAGKHILEVRIEGGEEDLVARWNISSMKKLEMNCYSSLNEIPASCEGGDIESDEIYGGCRIISCNSRTSEGYLQILACNKPSESNPSYYEMYRISYQDSIPQICLGDSCIRYNGYDHSILPACIVDEDEIDKRIHLNITSDPSSAEIYVNGSYKGITPLMLELDRGTWNILITKQGYMESHIEDHFGSDKSIHVFLLPNEDNETDGQSCFSSIEHMPLACEGGEIVQDSFDGCRNIICKDGDSGSMSVISCEKPDIGEKTYFEIYKQESLGSSVERICLGDVCISDNGYAKGDLPLCIENNSQQGGGSDGEPDVEDEGNQTDDVPEGSVSLSIAPWYPKGGDYVFICDASNNPLSYSWDFGDGSRQTSENKDVYHIYSDEGTYDVECTAVSDEESISDSITVDVKLEEGNETI